MIILKNLVKNYRPKKSQAVEALRGVSFAFPKKGLIFIVGKSGSGKSTLLNILGMLDTYDSGDLIINGKSSKKFTASERDSWRAKNIGFVFQEFHIIEKYNIAQNISLPLEITKRKTDDGAIAEVLKKVGLDGFENRSAAEISGGQRQRVAIARALIKNPKIILADEPTGSLDSVNGAAVFELLKELGKEKLVVVISHDVEAAHKYADQIVELADGLISGIFPGDGTCETVNMQIDKINNKNIKQLNTLIGGGKKVVLTRPKKIMPVLQETAETANTENSTEITRKPSLPFKSTARLSFLNIKAKWLRTFWTVLVSMFAIAFFGFADVIAQFSIQKVLVSEIDKQGVPFVNVAAVSIEKDSLFENAQYVPMSTDLLNKFNSLGIDYVKKYMFIGDAVWPRLLTHVNFFQDRHVGQYYRNDIRGVIECNNLSKLGLTLSAGRMPENYNEVIITNYMLERYKKFGVTLSPDDLNDQPVSLRGTFYNDNAPAASGQVNSFDDLYEKTIKAGIKVSLNSGFSFKIVGMIDFDLSQFESLAAVETYVSRLTDAQRALLRDASYAIDGYLNNYFVLEGFYNNFVRQSVNRYLSGFDFKLSLPETAQAAPSPDGTTGEHLAYMNVSNHVFNEEFFESDDFIFKDNAEDNFNSNEKQVVINYNLLWYLLPQEEMDYFYAMREELLEDNPGLDYNEASEMVMDEIIEHYKIFEGAKLHIGVNTQIYGGYNVILNSDAYEIVGINKNWNRGFYPTQIFYDGLTCEISDSLIIPAATNKQRAQVVKFLSDKGRTSFEVEGETVDFNFVVHTHRSYDIYYMNSMFKLFINIFSILSVLFCFFAILLTYSFIANSINARKKDIGILRSLGASGTDIAGIFILEGAIIALFEIILGAATCFIGFNILNKYFISQLGYLAKEYTLVSFGFRQIALMVGATFAAVALSVVIPIIRIARKQPVDAIRN